MFGNKLQWRHGFMLEGKPEVMVRILCTDRISALDHGGTVFGLITEQSTGLGRLQETPFYADENGKVAGRVEKLVSRPGW